MRKICRLCKHSKEIKYTGKHYRLGKGFYKDSAFFCLVGPPSVNQGYKRFDNDYISAGYDNLKKYFRYPEIKSSPACSLFVATKDKKKIKSYEDNIKRKKKDAVDKKIAAFVAVKKRKKAVEKRKAVALKREEKAEKKKADKLKKKKLLEYQKEYRAKKKNEREAEKLLETRAAKKEVKQTGRFELMSL